MPEPTIVVKYTCSACGIHDRDVRVTARPKTDDNVVGWLEKVCMAAVTEDHKSKSPDCKAKEVDTLTIPMGAASRVGAEPRR